MRVQKTFIAGMLGAMVAFSAGPAFALAWDWPYPWADPRTAAEDSSAVPGESRATESDAHQLEFASSRGRMEKKRSHTVGDKNALRDDRGDLAGDRSALNRDIRDR
ncbi:MAG TPA: hypothetical protein VFA56_07055 [Gaiellaceae bacterium]|jgi:hypothetical protein|nr:hypothetical protein [Gaiellaceae bacterium]